MVKKIDEKLRQEQDKLIRFQNDAKTQLDKMGADLRREFTQNLNQILEQDIKQFVEQAQAALSGLFGGAGDGSGFTPSNANAEGGLVDDAMERLTRSVLNQVLGKRGFNPRSFANQLAGILISESLGTPARFRQSTSQGGLDTLRKLDHSKRNG